MPDDISRQETVGSPADAAPAPLRRLGDFDLLREIGRGGMGIVYEARQISLNRRVALKILPPGLGFTDKAISRFRREAQAAARLHHTNIVPVYATGEEAGAHYYAMELIEGQSLAEVLRDLRDRGSNPLMDATVDEVAAETPRRAAGAETPGSVPPGAISTHPGTSAAEGRKWFDTAAHLIAEVADALHYAHGQGIVHRDIKPSNLMLSAASRLCVTDFGLARVTQEPTMTISGLLVGSPAYMSPEQVAAGRITLDHRTDVYSLGVVLYEMLTFRLPFLGDTREAMLTGIMTKEPPRPRSLNPRVPVDLETICLKAMEKDPDRRYATAAALAEDLRRYLQRGLIAARRAGPLRRTVKFARRHPLAGTVVLSAVAVAAAGIYAWTARARVVSERAANAIMDAQLALENGELREGLSRVDAALAIDPDLPEARLVRARLLLDLDRAPDAVSEARVLLRNDPGNLAARLILVQAAASVPGVSRVEQQKLLEERFTPEEMKTAEAFYFRSLLTDDDREAVELLGHALDLDPGNARALDRRARLFSALKRFPEALSDCDRLISVRPRNAYGRRVKASIYRELGDDRRALAELGRAIDLDRGDAHNFATRGILFCDGDRKSLKAAFSDLDEAIRLEPGNGRYYVLRARCNYSFRRDDRAVEDAKRALALSADRDWVPESYLHLVSALHRLGRDAEAREAATQLQQTIDSWPDPKRRAAAYLRLANLHRTIGDLDQALRAANRSIESAPPTWDRYTARAAIRRALKDEEGQKADCGAAAAVEINLPQGLHNRAIALRDTCARIDLALLDHDRAIGLAPGWGWAYLERGWTEVQARQYERGLKDYAKAIEIEPNRLRSYNARGWVLLQLERWEEALRDFDKALSLEPNRFSYCNRGLALEGLGRIREMKASWEKCLEYDPGGAGVLSSLGTISLMLGQTEEGLTYLRKAVEADPKLAFAHVNLAAQEAHAGQCEEARREMQTARDLGLNGIVEKNNFTNALLVSMHRHCPLAGDPEEALRYARELGGSERWKRDAFGPVLGLALYRTARYDEARSVLLEWASAGRKPYDLEWDYLVLAMAEWKLGRKAEARADYDRARGVERKTTETANDPDLGILREEAKSVLGFSERPR